MIEPRREGQDLARYLLDDLGRFSPLFRRRLVKLLGETLLKLAIPGLSIPESLGAFDEQLYDSPRAGAHLLGRHLKIGSIHRFRIPQS